MTAKRVALVPAGVVVVYLAPAGWRGVLLLRESTSVAITLGSALLVLPLVGAWVLWRELRFGIRAQEMARRLAADGGLPVDDLPRRHAGRPGRTFADAAFARYRTAVDAAERTGLAVLQHLKPVNVTEMLRVCGEQGRFLVQRQTCDQ